MRSRRALAWLAAALLAGSAPTGCAPGAPERPDVLLITLDTTRADHLGCYGHERATSPHLDALAAQSIRFTRALSTSSWTLPAHASLFTGKFPASHGARFDPRGALVLADAITAPAELRAQGLSPAEVTLAERLRDAGYDTAAVVGGPWLLRPFGLAEGFAHYDDAGITSYEGRRADAVTDAALAWLGRERDAPFFLFLNYFDPHFPYDPPEPWAQRFLLPGSPPRPSWRPHFEPLYDAEILFMDAQIGRLLDALRESGRFDGTLIVVTADHGELFGEHEAWGHQRFLYEELLRIPLIVKPAGPPQPGRAEHAPVQILDVFALILAAAGVAPPAGVQAQRPPDVDHPLLAEVYHPEPDSPDGGWRARWDGRFKLLRSARGRSQLFDLFNDPGEERDLWGRNPARDRASLASLEAAFRALPAPPPAGPERELDAETRKALKGLGYLQEPDFP